MSDVELNASDAALLAKLKEFYAGVVDLALNSDMVTPLSPDGTAGELVGVVFPYKLGPLLEKVNPEWFKVES